MRETGWPHDPRSRHNATHLFRSTARVAVGAGNPKNPTQEGARASASWAAVQLDDRGPTRRYTSAAPPGDLLFSALRSAEVGAAGAEGLLLDLHFLRDGTSFSHHAFVSKPAAQQQGGRAWVRRVYELLRWCGQAVNLNRPVAKTMGGFDCYGEGVLVDGPDGSFSKPTTTIQRRRPWETFQKA